MNKFLRENLMIVVSIVLPLLVVILFALASVVPTLFATPPAHDLLLTHQAATIATESPVKISLSVQDNRLRALVVKSDGSNSDNNPRLFRYFHVSGEVREIKIPISGKLADLPEGTEIPVAELSGLRVSSAIRAPDGYEFQGYRNRGGGLMMDLFGGNRNRHSVTIAKDGAITRVRLPATDNWYNEVRFLGWVTD